MNMFDKIRAVITDVNGAQDIKPEDNLKLDIGLDSLSLVAVIVGLEESFSITFDDSDLDPSKIILVKDIANLMEKYI